MKKFFLILFLLTSVILNGQEAVLLKVPKIFPTPTTITIYQPASLLLELVPTPRIKVILSANGERQDPFEYPKDCQVTPPAISSCPGLDTNAEVSILIGQLNNVNLSTRSLWKRVFDRLVADFPSRFPGGATVQ